MSSSQLIRKTLALAATVLLAIAWIAVADDTPDPSAAETGFVQVSVPLTTANITSVTYEITGDGIDPALSGSLTLAGAAATGTIAAVPEGSGRVITARAYMDTTQICEGAATFAVTADQTTNVNVLLECDDLVGSISISATFDSAYTADAATAQVVSADLSFDVTVPLTVTATTASGVVEGVPAGTGVVVTVTTTLAAESQCTGSATVDVVAGQQADATGITMACGTPAGAVDVAGTLNFKPRIHTVFASSAAPTDGDSITVRVVATDPDNDTLSYTWTDGGSNAFADASLAETTWDSTGQGGQTVTLTVSVSDSVTTAVTGTTTVTVASAPPMTLLINEVVYDGFASDGAESFVELYSADGANVDLTGYTIVAINGASGQAYKTFDLLGKTMPADGFFLIVHTDTAITETY